MNKAINYNENEKHKNKKIERLRSTGKKILSKFQQKKIVYLLLGSFNRRQEELVKPFTLQRGLCYVGFVLVFLLLFVSFGFFIKAYSSHKNAVSLLNQEKAAIERQVLLVSLLHEVAGHDVFSVQKSFAADYAYVSGGDLLVQLQLPSLENANSEVYNGVPVNGVAGKVNIDASTGAFNRITKSINNVLSGVQKKLLSYGFALFFGTLSIIAAAAWLSLRFSKKSQQL